MIELEVNTINCHGTNVTSIEQQHTELLYYSGEDVGEEKNGDWRHQRSEVKRI